MATPATVNPFNFYPGRDGLPLQNGYLYFGEPFQDPELQPLQAYWDDANTQPAARPIRTINGYPARNGAPAQVFVSAQYSMRVRDSQGREVFYAPNVTAVDLGGGGLDIITASGGQTVVTLTNAVYTPGSNAIDIALNGIIQISGQDYFETGTDRITMASALSAGDQIRAFARSTFGLTQAVLSDWQAEVFNGAGGGSQNFVLTRNPGAIANLDVSVTTAGVGSTLRPLIDYTLSGNTVTITPAPAVGTNNVLIRYGRSLPQDALRGELASTASESNGAGLIGISPLNYVAGTVGAWLMDGYVNVMWFMTAAERQDVRSGTGSIDVQPKLTAASTWAETLKKGVFLPSGVYKQGSTWAVPLSVGLLGETSGAPQAIFDPGTAWQYGPVIYKAHSGDSITKIAPSGAYNEAASIRNITFSSNRTTWPAGDCIVLDRVSHCHIYDCNAWSVGNDFIVIGRTAGDVTGHCYVFNCYSNAPVGAHYRIRAKWVRLENVVGDGGAYGIYLDNAPELRVQGWHFEGFSTSAVKVTNGSQYLTFTGKGVIGVTISNTATGFEIDNTAGNSSITIENVNMGGPSTTTAITFTGALVAATAGTLTSNWAGLTRSYTIVFSDGSVRTGVTLTNGSAAVSWTGAVTATANATAVLGSLSRAVWIKGNQATSVTTRNCQIRNWDIGVDDDGSDFTRVLDNQFDACRLPIRANSQRTQYKVNTATSTIGNCAIDHVGYVGASGGVWKDNILDKQILATLSGVKGNYGNNLVKNNRGFRTAYQGTSAAAASPIVMAHGLGAAPADADATILSGTYANLTVAFDATNVTVSWTGGANCQVQVRAQLSCELQYA